MKKMENKTAIITGGGRGIGSALCVSLARAGANVVINYYGNDEAAEKTKELCLECDGRAEVVKADISVFSQCEMLFSETENLFGPPDILINNAGITRDGLLMRLSPEDFEKVIDVNLKGAFFCTKLASRPMIKKRWGRIVNITSIVGLTGNAGQSNYASSKAGLIGLTKSSAKELASRGITVNAIAPGFVDTDMTDALKDEQKASMLSSIPLGRFGTVDDVAAAALFFVGEAAGYITGQVLSVNGGMAM